LDSGVPEAGLLEPLAAAPAEQTETIRLAPGQTFGEVLETSSVGWSQQNALLLAFREQANPRRMRDGTRITLRRLRDDGRLRGVDVQLNPDTTVRLFRDGVDWSSTLVNTPVRTDTLFVAGTVRNLLWNAILENPDLAALPASDRALIIHWMDRVFQWQIDFSRQVREGDEYRFVLELEVRPDGTLRSGHLVAAEYVNRGTPYRAIWFDPNGDGSGTFYDEDGKSVRRAFLMKPLEFRRISSMVNPNRLHPIHGYRRPHNGVDYAARTGTPVMATADGAVVYAGWKGEFGNLVEIRHPNGWLTRYGHLNAYGPGVRGGTRVRQGQIIGYVGMTGGATGPHLHYEMRRRNGQVLNPLAVRLPPGDPVPTKSWGRWVQESRQRLMLLASMPGPPIQVLAEAPEPDDREEESVQGGD
jgi:murein DD-endopeptidase MepM/ murein hydrolase activator NlpD